MKFLIPPRRDDGRPLYLLAFFCPHLQARRLRLFAISMLNNVVGTAMAVDLIAVELAAPSHTATNK